MSTYFVSIDGCDDSTPIKVEMNDEQAKFLDFIAAMLTGISNEGCMPTMTVTPWSATTKSQREDVEDARERARERHEEEQS